MSHYHAHMTARLLPALMLLSMTLTACSTTVDSPVNDNVSVAATFYPLAYVAERVGGSHVHVTQITPGGIEPHDFEPSPRDIAAIHDADVFVMNGGVDAWGEKILPELQQEGVGTVRMLDHVVTIAGAHEEEESDHDHAGETSDPHAWLDPVTAKEYVVRMRDALAAADAGHTEAYIKNADALIADLTALDDRFRGGLQQCALREVIVSHNAFAYLATRYNFETLAIAGVSPDEEPSAKRLAELSDIAEQKGIKHIFFEELVSPALAQTLASEVGATALVLNPLEGLTAEQIAAGEDYVSIMDQNLQHLRTAMQCR